MLQAIRYTPASGQSPPTLEILDQLLLPHETAYVSIQNCEEAHDAIKQMKVRGAPAIAIVAALALAVEVGAPLFHQQSHQDAHEAKELIGQRLAYLKTSRPTAVNLADAVGKLNTVANNAASRAQASGQTVVEQYIKAAEQMLVDDVSDNRAIGEHGAHWVRTRTAVGQAARGLQMITVCNTGSLATAGYGTALGIIRSLHTAKVLDRAYCLETRPYNQGSRLTAYELVHDHIPATLITDSMAASLMNREQDRMAAVVVGADRVAANGDTANKIGTYSLAVLAKHHGIKFLVAAPRTTIDLHTASGADIVIEQRAPEELTRVRGPVVMADGVIDAQRSETISTAALGIDIWNPAFDVTPASLIDGVVTELGVIEKVDGVFDFRSLFATATTTP